MSTLASAVQPTRARLKSTSSLQHPVVAHVIIPPPASVPSHRRSTSSLSSSTPPTPAATDTLMPACPTGWARFDMSPLNEVTQDTALPAAVRLTTSDEVPSTETQPTTDDAEFPPSSSDQDIQHAELPAVCEGQMSNDKFSDSFLAGKDKEGAGFEEDVNKDDSVVASSSFELMSPSSDKDSISLPSPEAPPPPLPANVVMTDLPSEPPVPPPRPRAHAISQTAPDVELANAPVTSTTSESVHSSPVQVTADTVTSSTTESPGSRPQPTTTNTSTLVNNISQQTTSTIQQSQLTVQQSFVETTADSAAQSLVFPSDDATPPPLPPRHVPTSVEIQKQQVMRGTSLPTSRWIHSVDDVPPPPPPRRSLSKPLTTPQAVDPFAPIPHSTVVESVKQQPVAAVTQAVSSNCSVVETTIAPLPRPRPHLRQTVTADAAAAAAASSGNVTTSSGSSSPWQPVNTPPILEPVPVDPFSNVDPFAGSESPDDPFAEPSLDGMLCDLSHDFDTDTLSLSAFRTRAVTINSVSSDVCDAGAGAGPTTLRHPEAAGDMSPVVTQTEPAAQDAEQGGTACLVDLNTADDVVTASLEPFSADQLAAVSGPPGPSSSTLYGDLQDVWYGGGSVDWKPQFTADITESSVSGSVVQQSPLVGTDQLIAVMFDGSVSVDRVCNSADNSQQTTTEAQTSQCSVPSVSDASSSSQLSVTSQFMNHSTRAVSEPPGLSLTSSSSIEQRNSSFDALFGNFGERLTSSVAPARDRDASTLTGVNHATCSSELASMSLLPSAGDSRTQNTDTTDPFDTDVQVIN